MNGWKTMTGGGLLIAWGVVGMVIGPNGLEQAIQYAAEGLGSIGIGHKMAFPVHWRNSAKLRIISPIHRGSPQQPLAGL